MRSRANEKNVIATHNQGKLAEFADLLKPYGVTAVSASICGLRCARNLTRVWMPDITVSASRREVGAIAKQVGQNSAVISPRIENGCRSNLPPTQDNAILYRV